MVHERAAQNIVPETYLLNKASCLRELDAALGHSGPPAVEYVFVESLLPDFGNRWVGVGFGHAAVRYTLPSGQQRLVNVTRGGAGGVESDTPLVQIYEDPADYYFGSNGNGGIFSRSVCLVRVQHWDADSVLAMDHWFRGVAHAFQRVNEDAQAKVGFNHCGALLDTARVVLGLSETGITGNCSNWTSQAMVLGGLSKRIHSFPKAILVDMVDHLLLDRARKDADKAREPLVQIAYLDRAGQLRRPKPSSVRHAVWHSMVAPFYLLKTWLYWDLRRYADVIVSVEAVGADSGPQAGQSRDAAAEEGMSGVKGEAAEARVRAVFSQGEAWRPLWSRRYGVVRSFHSIAIATICLAFALDPLGWWRVPCAASEVVARLFVVLVFVLLNAHWY